MLFEKNILQLLHKKYLHPESEAQNFIKTLEGGWFQIHIYDKDRNERLQLKTCSIVLQNWQQYSAGLSPLHPPTY